MATKYTEVTTSGPVEWAKIFENNRDMTGYEGAYVPFEGAYTLQQILSKDEYAKLQAAGTQKKPNQKRLMDGELMLKFERKHKVTRKDGTELPQAGGAPKVTDVEGNTWSEDKGLIGNGSTAEVTNLITTFKGQDGKMYSRTSMTAVKIIEHKPVEEKVDSNEMGW
jgi:hypothetical protein